MILSEFSLSKFRSYTKASFHFSPRVTLIIGINGVGKTNILEGIHALATGKSFRADIDREMISWDEQIARIKGTTEHGIHELLVTTGTINGQTVPMKKYLINGVSKRAIDFVGSMHAVLFWPEDLELVTDSPSLRRKYLDRVLVQVDREYRRNLLSYERALRQRNKLLDLIGDGRASRSQLWFWDQLLIKAGGYMTDVRAEYIDYVNNSPSATPAYQIQYDKSVISEARLLQYKDEEVAAGATLVGPHRDDFVIMKFQAPHNTFQIKTNNQIQNREKKLELSKYGSRGEQRLGVLWLKLAEVSFITDKTGDRPILLLDDIFSELDDAHRKLVLDLVKKQQTVITSAESDVMDLLKQSGVEYQVIQLSEA